MKHGVKTVYKKGLPRKKGLVVNFLEDQGQIGFTTAKVIHLISQGLPVGELDDLQVFLDVPMEQLAPKVGLSRATLHRRKATGRLAADESDKVVRFARLLGHAVKVLGDGDAAREWLTAPQVGLGGAVPLDYAGTEVGAREVEKLLGRIEYGVYS
jgi:putative toxin-antitoxin system antitoxin component (TIGR02293 family)